MSLVIDASVCACWLLPDEGHPLASAVRNGLRDREAQAPAIWWFEIRNVIMIAERKRRLGAEQAAAALVAIGALPIRCAPLPDAPAIERLARRHRLTFYDAAYLELAQREGLPLATLDAELREAAVAEGVPLVSP